MSGGIGIKEPQKLRIEDLLTQSDAQYSVPYFQREYSWTKDDWTDFFDDINECRKSEFDHFFGFMALKRNSKDIEIIEGQQRITTVTILVSVIRDMLKAKQIEKWRDIDKNYIKTVDPVARISQQEYKLTLSDLNRRFFQSFVQDEMAPADKISKQKPQTLGLSDRLIFDCYRFFLDKLTEKIKPLDAEGQTDYLLETTKIAVRNFIVITIDVDNEIAAYNIFQTLNDRGMDLALADLLKVHLLKLHGKTGAPQAKDRWDEIREILNQIKVSTFLRHYWLSTHSVVQEKDLLREFQRKVTNQAEAARLLKDLRIEAENYEALVNPTVEYWNNDPSIVELLSELKILSAQMPLPVLMAGAKVFQLQIDDFRSLIRMLISFVVRYVPIGERDNKTLERLLSDLSIGLRDGKYTTIGDIRERLRAEYVDDATFEQQFSTNEIKVMKVAKYILQKIENHVAGDREKFNKKITVEHILPKNPDSEWKEYLDENKMESESLIHRIGNLTLLLGLVNIKARNKFFRHKRDEIYSKPEQTRLKINESLATMENWNSRSIENRQKWLATQAKSIWKL